MTGTFCAARRFAAAAFFAAGAAVAQEPKTEVRDAKIREATEEAADAPKGFFEQDTLTGEWGGLRTRMRDGGFDLGLRLQVDGAKNLSGGAEPYGSELLMVFDATAAFDFEKLFGWKGGSLNADFQLIRSDPINGLVGALGGVDVYDSDDRTQLAQIWFDQTFADGEFKLRIGKFDANIDWALPTGADEFINLSVSYPPTISPMPTYPDPAFGAAFYVEEPSWYVRAAVMDGALQEGVLTGNRGLDTVFGAPSDVFYVAEGGPKWSCEGRLEGKLALGAWYHSGTFDRFDGGTEDGEFRPYAYVEQRITRSDPDDKESERGLAAFLRYGHADGDVSAIQNSLALGVRWVGPFAARPADSCGFAASWLDVTDDAAAGFDRGSETTLEAFYKFEIAPWFTVQPDLQYVFDPGAVSGVGDAWLAMVRVVVLF